MSKQYPDIPPVGANFEIVRKRYKLTGADFARIAGVEPMTFYRWRNGDSIPSWGVVVKISEEFGLAPGDFYVPHIDFERPIK